MSIRFYRRIRIFPGVTLNIGKSGVSVTLRRGRFTWTIGRRGHTTSVRLPGKGLSYRKGISHQNAVEGFWSPTNTEPKEKEPDDRHSENPWSDFK